MPLLDHFGIIAPLYDKFIPLRTPERMIEMARLPVEGPVLDAGGGTGRVTQALKGLGCPLVVTDLSFGMLKQAAAKDGLSPVLSCTEQLPYADGTFSRVLMVDALHHVYSQVGTAMELWRVLAPGGRIVVEEPDLGRISVKFVALAEKMMLMRSHFLSPKKIAALFPFPNARVEIEREGFNAWILVDKE